MVPILGYWEAAIGVCLLFLPLARLGLLLLAVRLPGTLLAFAFKADVCFIMFPWVPSPEGHYLIKDFLLFGAALVIGGTVRGEQRKPGIRHSIQQYTEAGGSVSFFPRSLLGIAKLNPKF